MRSLGVLGAFLAVVGTVAPAVADIWVWRDRMGVSHYTNALENVPVEYRSGAMTVARDWERAEPPPEPEPPPAAKEATAPEPAEAAPAPKEEQQSQVRRVDMFEAGVRAGLRAAETATATAIASSTVRLIAPQPEPRYLHGVVPFFGPALLPPVESPPTRGHRTGERRPFQGPAGPPPLGAAGPPPFQP